tara:strand:+ start:1439 stop:2080 length:642 start_codon:yes stop_codon:yes gene_type:complete
MSKKITRLKFVLQNINLIIKGMATPPPIWSDNIVRNFERVIEWTDAVIKMCDITGKDYEFYKGRVAYKISEDLQNPIIKFSANFGCILQWIFDGVTCINENPRLPDACRISIVSLTSFEDSWLKHISIERQILDELQHKLSSLKKDIEKKQQAFTDELSDKYSSYSDYSEASSSDEEEYEENDIRDEDENDEDDEEDITDTPSAIKTPPKKKK